MSQQPSETEDRPSISGDSEGCFVYIQGGLEPNTAGQLILPKQRPHLADGAVGEPRG